MAARKKSARSRAPIDSVPTPELVGMKVLPARVVKSGSSYLLVQGGKRLPIPRGPLTMPADLEPLVGVPVSAVVSRSGAEVVAIGTWPTPEQPRIKLRRFLCYVPADATLRRIRATYRDVILDDLVKQGTITDAFAAAFRS